MSSSATPVLDGLEACIAEDHFSKPAWASFHVGGDDHLYLCTAHDENDYGDFVARLDAFAALSIGIRGVVMMRSGDWIEGATDASGEVKWTRKRVPVMPPQCRSMRGRSRVLEICKDSAT